MSKKQDTIRRASIQFLTSIEGVKNEVSKNIDQRIDQLYNRIIANQSLSKETITHLLNRSASRMKQIAIDNIDLMVQKALKQLRMSLEIILNENQRLINQVQKLQARIEKAEMGQQILEENERLNAEIKRRMEITRNTCVQFNLEFKVLDVIEQHRRISIKELAKVTKLRPAKTRRLLKNLAKIGYVEIQKEKKPFTAIWLGSPWR